MCKIWKLCRCDFSLKMQTCIKTWHWAFLCKCSLSGWTIIWNKPVNHFTGLLSAAGLPTVSGMTVSDWSVPAAVRDSLCPSWRPVSVCWAQRWFGRRGCKLQSSAECLSLLTDGPDVRQRSHSRCEGGRGHWETGWGLTCPPPVVLIWDKMSKVSIIIWNIFFKNRYNNQKMYHPKGGRFLYILFLIELLINWQINSAVNIMGKLDLTSTSSSPVELVPDVVQLLSVLLDHLLLLCC